MSISCRKCWVLLVFGVLASSQRATAQQAAPFHEWEQGSSLEIVPIASPFSSDSARPSTGQRLAFAWIGGLAGLGLAAAIDQAYVGAVTFPLGSVVFVGLANRKVYDRWDLVPAALGAAVGSLPILAAVIECSGPGPEEYCGWYALPAIFSVPVGAAVPYLLWDEDL